MANLIHYGSGDWQPMCQVCTSKYDECHDNLELAFNSVCHTKYSCLFQSYT